ncbi:hypothetical protein [Streptomyces sp. NBC_01750]|uniref:hypothetical protein n=1 Tax=Streptomyces sp. NBC_01750 TaxID=2975928 RepID=UPI002DD8861A|nr:hypothetical protein [Streptomyces sp. NBC_01750]WSD37120.1 hypothetical protein OG966_37580 [Streptomyces sp. NBC_01750]
MPMVVVGNLGAARHGGVAVQRVRFDGCPMARANRAGREADVQDRASFDRSPVSAPAQTDGRRSLWAR